MIEEEKAVIKTFKEGYGLTNAEREMLLNLIYKSIEESAYYRDLVKLERKEKQHLKKSLKGQIAVKDTEINKLKEELEETNQRLQEIELQILEENI